MRWALIVLLMLCGSAIGQLELGTPTSVRRGSGELVFCYANGVQEDGNRDWNVWTSPPTAFKITDETVDPEGNVYVALAAPGINSPIVSITVQVISWDSKEHGTSVIVVEGGTPVDPVDPEPTPAKLEREKTRVMIVFDTTEQDPNDSTRSFAVDQYLRNTFGTRWSLAPSGLESQPTGMSDPDWAMYRVAKEEAEALPWLVMSDGNGVVSEPFQLTPEKAIEQMEGKVK